MKNICISLKQADEATTGETGDTKPLFSANGRDARPVRPVHVKAAASLSGLRKPTGHAQANRQSRTPGRISSHLMDLARLVLVDHLSRDERSAPRTLKQLLGMLKPPARHLGTPALLAPGGVGLSLLEVCNLLPTLINLILVDGN